MTDWLTQPTEETPWAIGDKELFESNYDQQLDCDEWLGQQLVIFDNRGITLKDVIRVTVNKKAAHSPPVDRLMLPKGNDDKSRFKVVKDREIHTLSHITVCGVRYSHTIEIQTDLHFYRSLEKNPSIWQQKDDVGIPVFCIIPDNVFLPDQAWLRFDGGLALFLGGTGQNVTHKIRAPK